MSSFVGYLDMIVVGAFKISCLYKSSPFHSSPLPPHSLPLLCPIFPYPHITLMYTNPAFDDGDDVSEVLKHVLQARNKSDDNGETLRIVQSEVR